MTEEHYTQKGLDIHSSIEAVLNLFPYTIRFEEAMDRKIVTLAFDNGEFIHPNEQFISAYSPIGFLENFIDILNGAASAGLSKYGPIMEIFIAHRGPPQFIDNMWFGSYAIGAMQKGAGTFVKTETMSPPKPRKM